jgi:hypothetical protein
MRIKMYSREPIPHFIVQNKWGKMAFHWLSYLTYINLTKYTPAIKIVIFITIQSNNHILQMRMARYKLHNYTTFLVIEKNIRTSTV